MPVSQRGPHRGCDPQPRPQEILRAQTCRRWSGVRPAQKPSRELRDLVASFLRATMLLGTRRLFEYLLSSIRRDSSAPLDPSSTNHGAHNEYGNLCIFTTPDQCSAACIGTRTCCLRKIGFRKSSSSTGGDVQALKEIPSWARSGRRIHPQAITREMGTVRDALEMPCGNRTFHRRTVASIRSSMVASLGGCFVADSRIRKSGPISATRMELPLSIKRIFTSAEWPPVSLGVIHQPHER